MDSALASFLNALKGKKSYLLAAGVILYQVLGYYLYQQPFSLQSVTQALGLVTLRAGVAKMMPAVPVKPAV
jgi:uncharacterized membrane protein HdeD (DUF308 family)